MPIFNPIGNTDEGSSSLGGSSRQWSPFSPFFNQRSAARKLADDERAVAAQTNPLSAEERKALLSREGTDPDSLVPATFTLAVGGPLVNREWADAAAICDRIVSYYNRNIAAVRAKMGKTSPAAAGAVTWGSVFGAVSEYCRALAAGRPPIRRARTKQERKAGATVSVWDDVRRSALASSGNVKLPFAAYSEMPVVTCPGAGGVSSKLSRLSGAALGAAVAGPTDSMGCASFCYSLKTFGKPSCVARTLITTLGYSIDPVQHVRIVTEQMAKLASKRRPMKILRLFVDGDFRDAQAVEVWMEAIRHLGTLGVKVYGYSKSWPEFLEVAKRHPSTWWPDNYSLNLSSGSRHDAATLARMRELPVSRGEFRAVDPLQRLCWKAFSMRRGEGIYRAYMRRLDSSPTPQRAEATKAQLGRVITRANPQLAASYNEWLANVHALDEEGASSPALKRMAKLLGGEALKPGPVVQAATWGFMRIVHAEREWPCPISCGACPGPAVAGLESVLKAAVVGDKSLMEGARQLAKESVARMRVAAAGGRLMHACGNRAFRQDIIIGLH